MAEVKSGPPYNPAALRDLVSAAFSDEDLSVFCFDHFGAVYDQFTAGQTKGQRVRLLLKYAERHGQLDLLLSKLSEANPFQYATFELKLHDAAYSPTPNEGEDGFLDPPPPPRPPDIAQFVGREAELAVFAQALATTHLAVITGMPGVGKTTLAARLAQQAVDPNKVFWHSFHEGEGIDVIIWKLAGFLAGHGRADLWRMLHKAQQTGGQSLPTQVLFDYLIQLLRGQGYLLCLDDFQFVDEDPLLDQLVQRLRPLRAAGEVSLILASRRVPGFLSTLEFEPLTGLTLADTQRLVAARGLALPDDLLADVYARTEGNAQFLTLAVAALQRAKDRARLIARLTETDDIERYLLTAVDKGLTDDERSVMSAVSVLLGYPGSRDAIEAILDGPNVRRILTRLCDRYLLTVHDTEAVETYGEHAIVRAFYYDMLGKREREAMHRRAGAYYETEEIDTLKAARHFEQGAEYAHAAALATADVLSAINQGQAHVLRHLLESFKAQQLDLRQWTAVNLARGEVYAWLGENDLAKASYEEARSKLGLLSDTTEARAFKVRTYRGMGELLAYQAPAEAVMWLRRGLEAAADASRVEAAILHYRIGAVLIRMADYAGGEAALDESLRLLPEGISPWRAGAMLSLGIIHCSQGNLKQGQENYLHALEMYQQLGQIWAMPSVWSNLGKIQELEGHWAAASELYSRALVVAEQLGSVRRQAEFELNLGCVSLNQGIMESARAHLTKCITLARQHRLTAHLGTALYNLADLHIRCGEWALAETALREAEDQVIATQAKGHLPEIHRAWARIYLHKGEREAALGYAKSAVALAAQLGLEGEEGIGQRVLAEALLADHQVDQALAAFERSLSLLAECDPYEAARTRLAWGLALQARADTDRAKRLVQAAHTAFQNLGATQDLAVADQALQSLTGEGPHV